jgi:hypothetical protein
MKCSDERHMTTLTEDEWSSKYKPINDDLIPDWDEIPEGTTMEHLWTQVEADDSLAILAGNHYVNRLGYWITEVAHDFEVEVELDISE